MCENLGLNSRPRPPRSVSPNSPTPSLQARSEHRSPYRRWESFERASDPSSSGIPEQEEFSSLHRRVFSAGFRATMSPTLAAAASPSVEEAKQTPSEDLKVVFVLGGPGSGKGTQCAKIVETFGFVHLSAGDLLRAEINSGNENGAMIQTMIKEGKIVPAEVTVKLLEKAMKESDNDKFLIDGFPRNLDNRTCFETVTGIEPQFILFFDCPEEEMERRLLGRNQGRVDDNIETIRKRFKVFIESSMPVVNHYEECGKVHKIDATKSVDDVFSSIEPLFQRFQPTASDVHEELVEAIQKHNIRGIPVPV